MPRATVSPSSSDTATLASASLTVADTFVCENECATDAAYAAVPDANTGSSVTPLSDSALSEASADPARVTKGARQFEQLL